MTGRAAAIVGAGRMGQGIGLALGAAGWEVLLLARTDRPVQTSLRLRAGTITAEAVRDRGLVLVATPDDAVPHAAAALAASGGVGQDHVVLHLSGLLDRTALAALIPTGTALGSFHPLQSVADPATAAERLRGAFAGIEGDPRALAKGREVAAALGMTAVPIAAGAKPLYHAGAVFASNYATALTDVAARLAAHAGVPPGVAARMYLPLAAGAAANVAELGAAQALTGPIRRGDVGTIRAHLAALPPDLRPLYRELGRAAVVLARAAGLTEATAREVLGVLGEGESAD